MAEEQEYGKKLKKLLTKKEQEIKQVYFVAIQDLSILAASLPYKNDIFSLDQYPLLKKRVDLILREMSNKIEIAIVNGIEQAWELSNQKNRVFLDRRLRKYNIAPKVRKTLYDPNDQAKKSFLKRKVEGLNLSDRIWNSTKTFKRELENGLGYGISEGLSATKMATEIKKNLLEPDKLFRRVKGRNGRLRLSKAAQKYKPGQGVYRSSYKNALRITRTETNMSYRTADYERWLSQPFVVGVEIRLSDAHPKFDICDNLAGKYPKDFKWVGWHPNCICYQTPILITEEEMSLYEDQILGLGKWNGNSINSVTDAPRGFYDYLSNNKDRINGYKSRPYWVEDNITYMNIIIN